MMKIDKEFIDELNDSPEDMVYLANIINSVRELLNSGRSLLGGESPY
jgi:EAL domain-containing protein (putative c-di-GMP-specific phosphodiesterase class I)